MPAHAHILPTYLRLRKLGRGLNQKLVETLDKDIIDEGGRKLGILQKGTLVLGSEDELSVVMDYCIYNVYRGGRNAVQRMLADSPPSNPDELALLEAQAKARYSIFQVSDVEKGVGVTLVDLLREDAIFVVDVGFGNSMSKGFGLAGRVIPQEGFFMSGGAMLPFDRRAAKRVERDLVRWLAKEGFRPSHGRRGGGSHRASRSCLPRRPGRASTSSTRRPVKRAHPVRDAR